jgi:choline dehydrogenase-like flavoprotein
MTEFVNFEQFDGDFPVFDLIIVGTGAAGITIARELSGLGANILLVESGALQEDKAHEELNEVDVVGNLDDSDLQKARRKFHGSQIEHWDERRQRYGVRCRVIGGSTAGWAGKVAPFDAVDYSYRDWIAQSGWPVDSIEMSEFIKRAGQHLNLGPIIPAADFWHETNIKPPKKTENLKGISSFFWQFARSRSDMIDIMRFGPDFRKEKHDNIVCLYNATATKIISKDNRAVGIKICSSLQGRKETTIHSLNVVLASGAIENARLILESRGLNDEPLGSGNANVGRYLMDHPSVCIGEFDAANQNEAAALLGFFPLMNKHRMFMYSHGLRPDPCLQKERGWPNLAVFVQLELHDNDPILALKRLGTRKSENVLADLKAVIGSLGLVTTAVGRRFLTSPRIPVILRRLVTDLAILIDANFVARDYQAKGRSRKLEKVSLRVICEQPPSIANHITLSNKRDRLGMRIPEAYWKVDDETRLSISDFSQYLKSEFDRVGIFGLTLNPEINASKGRNLKIVDMGHTAGTTRMGYTPATSVVDPNCQVHGVEGLYVSGASVFPTSGHANPTLMIVAFSIRLADHIKQKIERSVNFSTEK